MEHADDFKSNLTGKEVDEILVRIGDSINHSVTPNNIIFHKIASFTYDTFVHGVIIKIVQSFDSEVLEGTIDIEDSDGNVFAVIDSELLMTEDVSIHYNINRVIRAGSSIGLRSSHSKAKGSLMCKALVG